MSTSPRPRCRFAPLFILLAAAFTADAAASEVRAFEALVTRAHCEGPNGPFSTEIVSLADGTTRFLQIRGERRTELLLLGDAAYQTTEDGGRLAAAPPEVARAIELVVRGHEVHRMVLARPADTARDAPLEVAADDDPNGSRVRIEMDEWRAVHGIELPHRAVFLHEGERFVHDYFQLLPFRLAPGAPVPTGPEALFDRLGDLAEITALHQRTLDAHLRSDVEMLLADEADTGTNSGRGQLTTTTRETMRARLGPYLGATRFDRYADTAVPVVAVSADGSLGWLACEIEGRGEQNDGAGQWSPLAFGFSWVELVAREDDRWVRIGNASSARP